METPNLQKKQFIMYPILVLAVTAASWIFGFLSCVTEFFHPGIRLSIPRVAFILLNAYAMSLPFVPLFLYEIYRFKKYWASFLLPFTFVSLSLTCLGRVIYLFPFSLILQGRLNALPMELLRQPGIICFFLLSLMFLLAAICALFKIYPRFFTVTPLCCSIFFSVIGLFARPIYLMIRSGFSVILIYQLIYGILFYSFTILLAVSLLMICVNKDSFKRAPKRDKNAIPPLTHKQELKEIKDYYDRGILSESEYLSKKEILEKQIKEDKKKKPTQ